MLTRIFAAMGFAWAVKSRSIDDLETLRASLVALARPGVQLSGEAYRVIDSYGTPGQFAEFDRDYLNLRNKHAKRRARVGLVRCEMAVNGNDFQKLDDELKRIAEEEGLFSYPRRSSKDPLPPEDEGNGTSQTHKS